MLIAIDKRDYELTIEKGGAALSAYPLNAYPRVSIAMALRCQGEYEAATDEYIRYLDAYPWHVRALIEASFVAMQAGRLELAESFLERAAVIMPESANLHNNLGLLRQRQGRMEEALEELRTAAALNPRPKRDASYMVNIGCLLMEMKRYDEAERAFKRAQSINSAWAYPEDLLEELRKRRYGQGGGQ